MTLLADAARRILAEAACVSIGIVVHVETIGDVLTPVLRAKQVLYRFKSEDSDFANIHIRISPDDPDTHLWLIRTDAKNED